MRTKSPYIIFTFCILLSVAIFVSCKKPAKYFDERISFRKTDKVPYGDYVAYNHLQYLFPSATITTNNKAPDIWRDTMINNNNQALLIITPLLFADEYEMKALANYARNGNDVFISAKELSLSAQNYLHCEISSTNFDELSSHQKNGLEVTLDLPFAQQASTFSYPGKRYDSYFFKYDSTISYVLGSSTNENSGTTFQLTNFIRLKVGEGNIYVHLAPICFSNYFLLHHDNINYYDQILSVMSADKKRVVWDEYYLHKYYDYMTSSNSQASSRDNGSILSGLMSNSSLRNALWLLVFILILLALQEMRRKQRLIPQVEPPRNDSLDFVKTIGRLYYEKRDNKNLSNKMAAYFLEHVRSRYKLTTVNLDEKFITALQMKSGQPTENINEIVSFINNLNFSESISDKQVTGFHKQLEDFYKNA